MIGGRREEERERNQHQAECSDFKILGETGELFEALFKNGAELKADDDLSAEDQDAAFIQRGFNLVSQLGHVNPFAAAPGGF
jgi:hypothetical protein